MRWGWQVSSHHVSIFTDRLDTYLIDIGESDLFEEDTIINHSSAFLSIPGSYQVTRAMMTPGGVMLLILSNSSLIAVETVLISKSDVPVIIPRDNRSSSVDLPFPVAGMCCSREYVLLRFEDLDDNYAGAMFKISKIQPRGISDYKTEISLSLKISSDILRHTIPHSTEFIKQDDMSFLFAKYTDNNVLQVGAISFEENDPHAEIFGEYVSTDQLLECQTAKWNRAQNTILIVSNLKFLLFRCFEDSKPWIQIPRHLEDIVFVEWHPSDLAFLIGCRDTIHVYDLALNYLCQIDVHGVRGSLTDQVVWMMDDANPTEDIQDVEDPHRDSEPNIVCLDSHRNSIVVAVSAHLRFEARFILQRLLLSNEEQSISKKYEKCTHFVLGIRPNHSSAARFTVYRLLFGELSKLLETSHSLQLIQTLCRWTISILTGMRILMKNTTHASQQRKQRKIVQACETRYIQQLTRLGQLEKAYRFAFSLSETDFPSDAMLNLFNEISAWAPSFNQAEVIAPMARGMVKRCRHADSVESDASSNDRASTDDDDDDEYSTQEESGTGGSESNSQSFDDNLSEDISESPMDSTRAFRRAYKRAPLPPWRGGMGGGATPEKLGEMMDHIGTTATSSASTKVDGIITDWKQIVKSKDANQKLDISSARTLGIYFECLGQINTARTVYAHHQLDGDLQRLEEFESTMVKMDLLSVHTKLCNLTME